MSGAIKIPSGISYIHGTLGQGREAITITSLSHPLHTIGYSDAERSLIAGALEQGFQTAISRAWDTTWMDRLQNHANAIGIINLKIEHQDGTISITYKVPLGRRIRYNFDGSFCCLVEKSL